MSSTEQVLKELNQIVNKYDCEVYKTDINWTFSKGYLSDSVTKIIEIILGAYQDKISNPLERKRIRRNVEREVNEWDRRYKSYRVALKL